MAFRTNKMPVLQSKTASGAVAAFNTALAMPLASCNIAVNAWQEGSGDPSPVNVRPIHGFSEVNVTRAGKNLFDKTKYQKRKYIDENTGEIINISNDSAGISDYIPVKAGEVLYIPSKGTMRNSLFDRNKNLIRYFPKQNGYVTIPTDGYIVLGGYDLNIDTYQVEVGSEATAYEPYVTPTIYTKSLGEEIFGGSYNSATGDKRKTFAEYVITGNERFSATGSGQHVLTLPNLNSLGAKTFPITQVASMTCEFAPTKSYNSLNVAGVTDGIGIGTSYMIIGSEQYDNWSNLVGKKFFYELAEPIESNIGSIPISTNIGNNTIFADTGDIDLTYKDLDIAKRGNFREVFRLPS